MMVVVDIAFTLLYVVVVGHIQLNIVSAEVSLYILPLFSLFIYIYKDIVWALDGSFTGLHYTRLLFV